MIPFAPPDEFHSRPPTRVKPSRGDNDSVPEFEREFLQLCDKYGIQAGVFYAGWDGQVLFRSYGYDEPQMRSLMLRGASATLSTLAGLDDYMVVRKVPNDR